MVHPVLQTFLDFLFPPSASELLVRTCTHKILSQHLSPHTHEGVRVLFSYRDPLVRALIWQLKYNRNSRAGNFLGQALKEVLLKNQSTPLFLVPIPLSPKRLRERGFNQVTRILSIAAEDMPQFPLEEGVLKRRHRETPQAHLSRTERLSGMDEVFYLEHAERIHGTDIMIIDDVLTTGATLRAAKNALAAAGPRSITCVALAH